MCADNPLAQGDNGIDINIINLDDDTSDNVRPIIATKKIIAYIEQAKGLTVKQKQVLKTKALKVLSKRAITPHEKISDLHLFVLDNFAKDKSATMKTLLQEFNELAKQVEPDYEASGSLSSPRPN